MVVAVARGDDGGGGAPMSSDRSCSYEGKMARASALSTRPHKLPRLHLRTETRSRRDTIVERDARLLCARERDERGGGGERQERGHSGGGELALCEP